jgi:nucleoid DNA-binding protein
MAKLMSKSEMIEKISAEHSELSKKQVKGVIESMVSVGHKELKKNGAFVVPGFAKFVVIKKPATKERQGINPFTKEPTGFKARPARKIIKARPGLAQDSGDRLRHLHRGFDQARHQPDTAGQPDGRRRCPFL